MNDDDDLEAEFEKLGQEEVAKRLALGHYRERKAPRARRFLRKIQSAKDERTARTKEWRARLTLAASIVAALAALITAFR